MTFKSDLNGGMPLLGTFIKTPHPHVIEVLSQSPFDCLCLDAEHAPFDRRDLDSCILAARSAGMPVLVRPASKAPHEILNALDCGADGILAPHIRSAADARTLAASAHYGPGGDNPRRGYAGSSRAAGYGGVSIADHLEASRNRTVVIAQIEDVEALAEIDKIAEVDGIDALFVGRIDLTIALGCTSPKETPVLQAVEAIVSSARAAGRAVGMFTSDLTELPEWRSKGVGLFLLASDHAFLRSGAENLRKRFDDGK